MPRMYRRLAIVVVLLALAAIVLAGWFLLRPTMRVTFHVVAEDGSPVAGTGVTAWTYHSAPGGDRAVARTIQTVTDAEGFATVTLASRRPYLGYRIQRPDHPGTSGAEYTFQRASWGRWLPWHPTLDVTLKSNQQPIAMYAREVGATLDEPFPEAGQRVGYDLMVGDWVAPHGKGQVADFLFTYTELEKYQADDQPFEVSLILAFDNPGDGIQATSLPNAPDIRQLHKAPADGYAGQLRKRIKKKPDQPVDSGTSHPGYYFRIRTQLDELGHVRSAHYGRIDGDITFTPTTPGRVRFQYYLTPTPNDRNILFDPEKNLFPAPTPAAAPEQAPSPNPTPAESPESPTPAPTSSPTPPPTPSPSPTPTASPAQAVIP